MNKSLLYELIEARKDAFTDISDRICEYAELSMEEHKSVACYEAGKELTVENVRGCSRLHPRCGTSFLFMVMIISILFFSLFSWSNVWVRMITRLAMLPVVAGISYEINRFAGRHDNALTNLLRKPGLALQRLTTAEPTDDMMEVDIEAMNRVIPENENEDNW